MTASVETWTTYAQLLAYLCPRTTHLLFADPGGRTLWSSDPSGDSRVQYALSLLLEAPQCRPHEIDGLAERQDAAESRFGFRLRGSIGQTLGLLVIALPTPESNLSLSSVHVLIKPALDCLQSELSEHADVAPAANAGALNAAASDARQADRPRSLSDIPAVANQRLSGLVAALLLPGRHMTICRTKPGQAKGIDSDVQSEMHRHLVTRAQLHGCTLIVNQISADATRAASPYKAISTPLRDSSGRVIGVVAVFREHGSGDFMRHDADLLEHLAREASCVVCSSFDPCTGMLTESAFKAQTESVLASHEAGARSHGLLHIDIDQLSVINENHGMHVGDEVIQGIAGLLTRRARESVIAARIAGDRFLLLLPDCGIEPAARIAEELRGAAIRLSGARGESPLLVSLSIGVARIGDRGRGLDDAIAGAALACGAAKERGRNRVEVFGGDSQNRQRRPALSFAAQAAAALAANAFELVAQPILPLSSTLADPWFEVLLRMRRVDGTRMGIEKLCGSEGLMCSIDRWVIEQTVERLEHCREALRAQPARFSLNLSAASLSNVQFWRMLQNLVRGGRIDAGTLAFEFSERAANANAGIVGPAMTKLRDEGVCFAFDNVGRCMSDLAHLNSLPVSCIKIDGKLIRELIENPKSQSTVVAIARLAKTFGLETVATHVEHDAIRAYAADLAVDYGQGFFIGKPAALDDVIHDLPLYSCFATSTGLIDPAVSQAALRG